MKTRKEQSQSGKSLLVTFHEGYSTYTITVPMPYAVRFFAEGAHAAIRTLKEDKELLHKMNDREGEKEEVATNLKEALRMYDDILKSILE